MASGIKYIRKSENYKYVYLYLQKDGKERWEAKIFNIGKCYDTEKEAAIEVDRKLIEKGKKPINILIPKICAV